MWLYNCSKCSSFCKWGNIVYYIIRSKVSRVRKAFESLSTRTHPTTRPVEHVPDGEDARGCWMQEVKKIGQGFRSGKNISG